MINGIVLWLIIFAGGVLAGMGMHKLVSDRAIARLGQEHQTQVAEWQAKVAEEESKARRREADMQAAVDREREVADESKRKISEQARKLAEQNAAIARLRDDAGGLRIQLAAYAAGRGAEDSLGACQARAARLGELLAEGGGLLAEGAELAGACAIAADDRAVKLRACLAAWPK